jgi:glycosyltransferase involved in cell wall biosynthesis
MNRSSLKKELVVEGWRFICHSYAIVNQWQLLALLRRNDVTLHIRDVPFYDPSWKRVHGLFAPAQEAVLAQLPMADVNTSPDTTLRISFPYNFSPIAQGRLAVFGTAEYGIVTPSYLNGSNDIARLAQNERFTVIAPSHWSAAGFLHLGLRDDQVVVIPHGVDPTVYRPDAQNREAARKQLHLGGFAFLTVGAMTGNKGMHRLLRAFARVAQKHSDAKLILKGADDLYNSREMLQSYLTELSVHDQQTIANRIIYFGGTFPMEGMAKLYRLADAYVSPYSAEGFNMPVLEGAASGLPVICTSGGPTDDFVTDSFARKIRSKLMPTRLENIDGYFLEPDVDHLTDLMFEVIENVAWRRAAAIAGPQHVASNYTWDAVAQSLIDALFGDARPNIPHDETFIQAAVQRGEPVFRSNSEIFARTQQPPSNQPRRNERCPCGSGKRYKHCCGSHQ